MIGGVAAVAAVRTFPFRVFSFPAEIVRPRLVLIEPYRHGFYVAREDNLDFDFYEVSTLSSTRRQALFNLARAHESLVTNHES